MDRGMRLLGGLTFAWVLVIAGGAVAADDGAWLVQKSSGEVWISATGAQPATLKED